MIKRNLGLLLFCLPIFGCRNSHTAILSITEMKPIIWDMLNADNWYLQTSLIDTSFRNKKANIVYYNKIFQQYDITKDQFYNSYSFYELHPEKMKILLDSVEAYGNREKMNLDKPFPINKPKK